MEKVFHQIVDVFPAIFLAIAGGIAKLLMSNEKISFRTIISSLFVSGFVGALTAWLIQPMNLHPGYVSFICAMAGHSAGLVLFVYQKKVESFLERAGGDKD